MKDNMCYVKSFDIKKHNNGKCLIKLFMFNLVLLLHLTVSLGIVKLRDEKATHIDLTGIKGPYTYRNYCRIKSGELWWTEGEGGVGLTSPDGEGKEFQVSSTALNGIFFISPYKGWVVGDGGTIFYTDNRGEIWSQQDSGTKVDLSAVTCTDENNCWVVGKQGTILSTKNAGSSWIQLEPKTQEDLLSLSFVSTKNGWVVGDNGVVLETNDNGKSWQSYGKYLQTLNENSPYPNYRTQSPNFIFVKFIDKKKGWVATRDAVASTRNGGINWEIIHLETTLIGLAIHDHLHLVAVSLYGDNYVSNDGGISWQKRKTVVSK